MRRDRVQLSDRDPVVFRNLCQYGDGFGELRRLRAHVPDRSCLCLVELCLRDGSSVVQRSVRGYHDQLAALRVVLQRVLRRANVFVQRVRVCHRMGFLQRKLR